MYWMITTIALSVISGLLMLATRFLPNRALRIAAVIALQVMITACGWMTVLRGDSAAVRYLFTDTLSVGFAVDDLSRFFCALIVTTWLLVTVYAGVYMKHEKNEDRFFLFSFLIEGAILGAVFSDNLVSMYVFYEMVTLFSVPLVLHSLSKEAVAAAKKYLYYSVAGAFMALFGIFVISTQTDSLLFAPGGVVTETTPLLLAAAFMMCVGFGAKAGLFPLHGWLPTAHPVAPAPASALLSGIIAKMGVLAIIRTVYFIIGPDRLAGTWVQTALLILALLTVLMGSMMAYREKIFKKRLAYSTVSQISYVLTGLFLFSQAGVEGAMWQILFHAAVKVGLFLCAGAVIFLYGRTRVEELDGIGQKMPVTFACFTVLSLSLIGIPPTGGFFSKWYLATASLANTGIGALSWLAPIILLLSALLTAGYLLQVTIKAFFQKDVSENTVTVKEPVAMTAVLAILALVSLLGGLFSTQTGSLLQAVASSLFVR